MWRLDGWWNVTCDRVWDEELPTLLVVPVPAHVLLLFSAGRDGIFFDV